MASNGLEHRKITALPSAISGLSNVAEFFPGMPKSSGYRGAIDDEKALSGRPAGKRAWARLANLSYWSDRSDGIGGFWATEVLAFVDPISLPGYFAFVRKRPAHPGSG